jgi:hypothetical protein
MDLEIKITAKLKDSFYGFSDLLDGRELNEETKAEIKDLIMEDISDIIDGAWEINKLPIHNVSKCVCDNVDDIKPYYDIDGDMFRCDKCDKHFC